MPDWWLTMICALESRSCFNIIHQVVSGCSVLTCLIQAKYGSTLSHKTGMSDLGEWVHTKRVWRTVINASLQHNCWNDYANLAKRISPSLYCKDKQSLYLAAIYENDYVYWAASDKKKSVLLAQNYYHLEAYNISQSHTHMHTHSLTHLTMYTRTHARMHTHTNTYSVPETSISTSSPVLTIIFLFRLLKYYHTVLTVSILPIPLASTSTSSLVPNKITYFFSLEWQGRSCTV